MSNFLHNVELTARLTAETHQRLDRIKALKACDDDQAIEFALRVAEPIAEAHESAPYLKPRPFKP